MISEYLQEIVDDGDLLRLFLGPQQKSIHRSLDFGKAAPKHDMQNNSYRVLLRNSKSPLTSEGVSKDVVCLFPNNNNKSHRILESKHYSSRDEFNKELNARFAESTEQTEQFKDYRLLILYGSHCFICGRVTGTLYVVWAERVVKINASNTTSIPYVDVPMIFNLDGLNKTKGIYLLRPNIDNKPNDLALFPLTQGNPVLLYNKSYNPFVCEKRPDKFEKKRIQVISQEEAYVMVMQTTQDAGDWIPFERLPFSEVEDQGLVEIEHTSAHLPWIESPREIFLDSSFGGAGNNSGLLIRESAKVCIKQREPDPFADTVDDELSSFSQGVEIDMQDL
jgi:hypothetical protein